MTRPISRPNKSFLQLMGKTRETTKPVLVHPDWWWPPTASMPPVSTKTNFSKRYRAREFGNGSPTWDTFEEFEEHSKIYKTAHEASQSPKYHLRGRVAGSETHYNLSAWHIYAEWAKKPNKHEWYCSAMAPTEKTLFQGEIRQADINEGRNGWDLYYSCQRKTMREALATDGKNVSGTTAQILLEHFLPVRDLEWLMGLLERYPNHVVEFSTYSVEFGTVPGFNTLFWEVRNY